MAEVFCQGVVSFVFRYDFEILPSKILYLTKAIESENDMLFSKVSLI